MEVCEEIISYPFMKYKVNVSHVTSRNSTAFEWVFLEVLIKSRDTEFQDENIEDFFKNYFQIDNPEKLIKPSLKKLYDLQAIACPKLTNDISLSALTLHDVEVLPLGKEMQQKGLLPGERSNDMLDVVFDVSRNKLITDRTKFSAKAEGIPVSVEESIFPEKLVRDYIVAQRPKNKNQENAVQEDKEFVKEMLSQDSEKTDSKKSDKKGKKNKQKELDWLKDNTEIDSVVPTSNEMCFDNITRKVHLQDGLIWKLESNKNVELEEISLKNFENTLPENLVNCPLTAITKPDEQIRQIVLFKDLKKHIQIHLNQNSYQTAILQSVFFENDKSNQKNRGKRGLFKIVILSASEKISIEIYDGWLLVAIPERILPSNCLFMNENFSINAEKFPVKAGEVSKELTFAYLPKNAKPNLKNFILPVVEKYFRSEPRVLFLLNEYNGLKNEFDSYFEKLISNLSAKEKAGIIESLNKQYTDLTGRKIISDENISRILFNIEQIKTSVNDFKSARKIIEEFSSIPMVRNKVLTDFLKSVLELLNPIDSVLEIRSLIDLINKKNPDSTGFLDKQGILWKLYSEKAKNDCFETLFKGGVNSTLCDFDKRVRALAIWYQKIKNIKDGKQLRDALNTWKNNFGNLRKHYGTIETAEKYNREIESKFSVIRNLNGGKK